MTVSKVSVGSDVQQISKRRFIKSGFDRAVAAVLLVGTSPLILAISLLVLVTMGRPVVFCQHRPGLHGRVFTIYKFRTMRKSNTPSNQSEADEVRITRLGGLLRRTSLDELPQLVNVLKGDLSLVGPRPLLVEYLDRYTDQQMRRHEVMPGITGWTQVNGRNSLEWERKFDLDIWYVDNWSLRLDFRILYLTLGKVFSGKGVSYPGSSTMIAFDQKREPHDS